MAIKILQINFNYKVETAEYVETVTPLAEDIANVRGMQWKVWLLNEENKEAGGIYCFDNAENLQAYLDGPIVAGVVAHPALENISAKVFDSIPSLTGITRGPV